MPKTLCEHEYRTRFLPRLCVATENIWGRELWGCSFLDSLHAHIRSSTKGESPIGPQLWGEVISPGGRGPNSPISSGLFGPYAARCAFHKLPHWKRLRDSSARIFGLGFFHQTVPLGPTRQQEKRFRWDIHIRRDIRIQRLFSDVCVTAK
jgi:hypothetical protein